MIDSKLPTFPRPHCPACNTRMISAAVPGLADGAQGRAFECLKCGHAETRAVLDPVPALVADDWYNGEPRWPDWE